MGINSCTIEEILSVIGQNLSQQASICVIGSCAALVSGQPERQTPDIDVWRDQSDFDTTDFALACEKAGLLYNPQCELDAETLYVQIIRPGIVSLPSEFPKELLGRYGNLKVVMPSPEVIVAMKLVRGLDKDIEDSVWWIHHRNLQLSDILSAIQSLPRPKDREMATENLFFIELALQKGHSSP